MLLIQRNGCGGGGVLFHGGMRRYYRGSGMIADIGLKLFSSGIKKALSGTTSAIAHKVVDAVVNGAASKTSKEVVNAIAKEVISAAGKASANVVFDSIAKKEDISRHLHYSTVEMKENRYR